MKPRNNNDPYKNINFSFDYGETFTPKKKTIDQEIARLNSIDQVVSSMKTYAEAEVMLNKLYNKG